MALEKRPHLVRHCPLKDREDCDWVQVTSWYVGGPHRTWTVPQDRLEAEAVKHMERHFGPKRTWFV
jgi:hypothetical protein